jgi:hypothetical protein
MTLYHLKPCMSRSRTSWSQRVSLAERSRSSFVIFVLVCVQVSLSLSTGDAVGGHQWEVQALSARIHAGVCRRCRVPKKVFTFRAR